MFCLGPREGDCLFFVYFLSGTQVSGFKGTSAAFSDAKDVLVGGISNNSFLSLI